MSDIARQYRDAARAYVKENGRHTPTQLYEILGPPPDGFRLKADGRGSVSIDSFDKRRARRTRANALRIRRAESKGILEDSNFRNQTYNIGGNNELENIDLVLELCNIYDKLNNQIIGTSKKYISFVKDRLGHDWRYSVNIEKIHNDLHWTPKIKFEIGIENTLKWYLDNREWMKSVLATS